MTNSATLSLCIIVKNEEANLPGCLESVKDIVNQIVIVDTGSTDRTIEIAGQYGAEVYHFPWINDFSAARNESIRHATCDWILWLDADERIEPSTLPLLKECLKPVKSPLCYLVTIRSFQDGGKSFHDSDAHRLFSNGFGIRFDGKIHEQIVVSARKLHSAEKQARFLILHEGYNLQPDEMAVKIRRNRVLLEELLKEEKQNRAYFHFTLGQNYSQTNEHKAALGQYQQALDLRQLEPKMEASLLNCISQSLYYLKDYDKSEAYAHRSLKLIPLQAGAIYNRYKLAEARQDWNQVVVLLNQLLTNTTKLTKQPKQISTDTLPALEGIYAAIGGAYLNLGDKKSALKNYCLAWDRSPTDSVLERIIALGMELNDMETLSRCLQLSINKSGITIEKGDLLGVAYIKLQQFDRAINIYEQLFHYDPGNVQVGKRLAALYAKTGRTGEAERLLGSLNNRT